MHWLLSLIKLGLVVAIRNALSAYLDPGSGSLIVQILVAIIVGALATFRLWKYRLQSLFGVKQDREEDDANVDAENSEVDQL